MGQGSGDEIDVYQSLCKRGRQAKKNAGFIPFFRIAYDETTVGAGLLAIAPPRFA